MTPEAIDPAGQPYGPEFGGDDIDVRRIGRALKRKLPLILGVTLIAFVGSFMAVNVISPRYTGEARILLESRDSFYTRPDPSDRENASFDPEAVQSQVLVIMSRDLARRVIKEEKLVGNPEFDPAVSGLNALKSVFVLLGLMPNPADRAPDDRVLEEYYNHLTVYPVGKSRVVAIEFSSKNPELAARTANTIARYYIEMQETAKKDMARSASTWLASNIDSLRTRVRDAESKVETFRARNGLLIGTNNTVLSSQQLAELSTQLASARSAQADAQAKAKLISDLIKQKRIFEIPDVANNDLIRRLLEQRITLRGQLAFESRTLLPEHPRIKELQAQLADLDEQIRASADRTVRSLEAEAKVAGSRVDTLAAALDTQKQVTASANENEVQLRALERDAKTLRDQLESYLVKYREAVARDTEKAQPADARIVSGAIVPTIPSFPKKLPTILLTTLAAFILTAGFIILRELLTVTSAMPGYRPYPNDPHDPPPSGPRGPRGGDGGRRWSPKWPFRQPGAAVPASATVSTLSAEDAARFNAPYQMTGSAAAHDADGAEDRAGLLAMRSRIEAFVSRQAGERAHDPEASPPFADTPLRPTVSDDTPLEPSVGYTAPQQTVSPVTPPSRPNPAAETMAPAQPDIPTQRLTPAAPIATAVAMKETSNAAAEPATHQQPLEDRLAPQETAQRDTSPQISEGNLGELAETIATPHADGRGRTILITQTPDTNGAHRLSRALGRHLARRDRVILVTLDDDAIDPAQLGFADLVAGRATFLDVIDREPGSRLHVMAPGQGDADAAFEPEAFATASAALDQTYDWVIFVMVGGSAARMRQVASQVDAVAVSAKRDDAAVPDAREALIKAGAKHIVTVMQDIPASVAA